VFRRTAGPVRLTLFDGAHSVDVPTGMRWFDEVSRGKKSLTISEVITIHESHSLFRIPGPPDRSRAAGADVKHVVFDSHAKTREKFATEYVPTLMHEWPVPSTNGRSRNSTRICPPLVLLQVSGDGSEGVHAQRFLLRLYTRTACAPCASTSLAEEFGFARPCRSTTSRAKPGRPGSGAVFNKSRNPFWMAWWTFRRIDKVQSLAVAWWRRSATPRWTCATCTFQRRSRFRVIDKLPVVDEFGQWIPAEYPGKAKSLEQ